MPDSSNSLSDVEEAGKNEVKSKEAEAGFGAIGG